MKYKLNNINVGGFTLMEAMISISIMLIAVVAAMSLTTQSIKLISITRQRMVASMLARESMELIRNRRDRNFLEMILEVTGEGNFPNEKWLDGMRSRETRDSGQPCNHNGEGRGCVASIDPTPSSKNSQDLVKFRPCEIDGTGGKENRCWIMTNSGEDYSSDSNWKDEFCRESDNYSLCMSMPIPVEYNHLYRQHTVKNFSGGEKGSTPFRRMSEIKPLNGSLCDTMAVVTTKIVWSGRFGARSILVEDHLYNWVGRGLLGLDKTSSCS